MFETTDQDLTHFLEDDYVRELLSTLSKTIGFVSIELLSNFFIYLFYSLDTNKNDWILDVITTIDNKKFTTKQLAPSLYVDDEELEKIFNNIREKAITLITQGSLIYNDTEKITYDTFNEYVSSLYEFCQEKYQWV